MFTACVHSAWAGFASNCSVLLVKDSLNSPNPTLNVFSFPSYNLAVALKTSCQIFALELLCSIMIDISAAWSHGLFLILLPSFGELFLSGSPWWRVYWNTWKPLSLSLFFFSYFYFAWFLNCWYRFLVWKVFSPIILNKSSYFLALPMTCRSSWARDQTHATVVIRAKAVTTLNPYTCCTTRELQ